MRVRVVYKEIVVDVETNLEPVGPVALKQLISETIEKAISQTVKLVKEYEADTTPAGEKRDTAPTGRED